MKLAELKSKGQKILDEMAKIDGKMADAADQELEDLKALKTEKEEEFKNLETEIEEAKAQKRRYELLNEISGTDTPKADVPAAKPKDEEKNEIERGKVYKKFFELCRGKDQVRMDENEAKAINMTNYKDQPAIKLGKSTARNILGKNFAKTMYSDDSGTADSQYLAPDGSGDSLVQLPFNKLTAFDLVNIVPVENGTTKWPRLKQDSGRYGSFSVTWADEGDSKTSAEPTFEQLSIETHEVNAYTEVTDTLLRRSVINLEQFLQNLGAEQLRYAIESKIINGSGTGEPLGVLQDSDLNSVSRDTTDQISYDDLVDVETDINPADRSGMVYILSATAKGYVSKLKDTANAPIFHPNAGDGTYGSVIGYPMLVSANAQTLGTTGDVIAGNFANYILAMEQDIVFARSTHYKFQSNCTAFKLFAQVGGRPANGIAFSALSSSTT